MLLNRKTLVGLTISLAFFLLVFWRIPFSEFRTALSEANYVWIIPSVIVYFLAFALRAWRWQHLLAHLGDVSLARSYQVATIGYAANNVLPLRLGEFLRAFLLRRKPGLDMTASLATIAVERILDGLTLLVWLGVGLFFFASIWSLSPLLTFAAQGAAVIFLGAGTAVMASVLFPQAAIKATEAIVRPLPERHRSMIISIAMSVLEGFSALRAGRKIPFYLLLSNAVWAGETVVYILVAKAMGVETSLIVMIVAVAASNLATTVPSTSGGIGPFELLAKETLVRAGTGAGLAAAYAIVIHATLWIPVTIAGAVLLMYEGVPLRDAVRAPRLVAETSNGQEELNE